jgi:hypothetical protein
MDASASSLREGISTSISTRPRQKEDPPPLDLMAEATAINACHDAVVASLGKAVADAIEAGKSLLKVKAALGHGKFLPWLADNVNFSGSSARGYMRLARASADPVNRQRVVNLSVRRALAALVQEKPAQRSDLKSFAFVLKLVQPCVMVTEYAPILVHFCFDGEHVFAYDAVAAIIIDYKSDFHFALRGEVPQKLVKLAGDELDLAQEDDDTVRFRSGRTEVMLPYLRESDFLLPKTGWLKERPSGLSFTFDDDLLQGWRLCAKSICKDAPNPAWTALNLRVGPKPVLAACDGVAMVRYRLARPLGEEERTVLIPKSVVNQLLWIGDLLQAEPTSIKATLGTELLHVEFAGGKVRLIGKLLPEPPFEFDAPLAKVWRPARRRQPIPEGFADAFDYVAVVLLNEHDKLVNLSTDGKTLLVWGNGTQGDASTSFTFGGAAAEISCHFERLTRYLGEVETMTVSEAGVVFYGCAEHFVQFVRNVGEQPDPE